MSNTPKLSWFVWGTLRFDSIRKALICTTRSQDPWNNDTWTLLVLKTWQLQLIRMRHFTTQLNSHRVASRANRLPACRINSRGNDSRWFDWIESNWQHFQPTLHSPPEVKICEIKIHEPSSFLKCGHKLQLICAICADLIESTTYLTLHCPGALYFLSLAQIDFQHVELTVGETIRVDSIESTTFSTHPQSPDQLYFLSLAQIDFRHVESTEGEMICVDSME